MDKKVEVKISIGITGMLIIWSIMSGFIGLAMTRDGWMFPSFFGYTFVIGLYGFTGLIPYGNVFYFLPAWGNASATVASWFGIASGNPWLMCGVDGLFCVLWWIIAVIEDIIISAVVIWILHQAFKDVELPKLHRKNATPTEQPMPRQEL